LKIILFLKASFIQKINARVVECPQNFIIVSKESNMTRDVHLKIHGDTEKKYSGFNKIFSPILSNKFLIRITKFLLSL